MPFARILLTSLLILLFTSFGTAADQAPKQQPPKAQPAPPAAASPAQQGTATADITVTAGALPKATDPAQPISSTPLEQALGKSCTPGQEDRNSDLCAQWKAADAAKDSARWTMKGTYIAAVGTIISLIGTIGVYLAYQETKKTTMAALDAAKSAREGLAHAERSANASEEAIKTAKEVARSELQAYVSADALLNDDFTRSNPKISPILKIKNHGNTIAKLRSISMWIEVKNSDEPPVIIKKKTAFNLASNILVPDREITVRYLCSEFLTDEFSQDVFDDKFPVRIRGKVEYEDIYTSIHQCEYAYVFHLEGDSFIGPYFAFVSSNS